MNYAKDIDKLTACIQKIKPRRSKLDKLNYIRAKCIEANPDVGLYERQPRSPERGDNIIPLGAIRG